MLVRRGNVLSPSVPQAVLGFGSNLGARRALLRCALELLAGQPGLRVLARSSVYETPAVGPPQPDYLNAAVGVSWVGSAPGLLALTRQVELLLGRERRVRWGARTIDLDLLLWSEGPVRTPELEVPHPRLAERNFALAPLLDVLRAPEVDGFAPELAQRYARILARLGEPPRAAPGWLDGRAEPQASADEELACLGVSAVGACAQPPARARASLPFVVQGPLFGPDGRSALDARVQAAFAQGFRVRDAAIVEVGAGVTRGCLLGEHSGHHERLALRAIVTERPGAGRSLALVPTGPT
jgi:2-amino-4-hydroxy-6-hydroxymethyldihydropteridine diphosphokinase